MQHDPSKITPLQRIESRVRNARTPDRLDARQMDSSVMSVGSPRRKVHTSRQSSVVLNTTSNLRKLETESYNLDMELAYSDYIASHMELILENEALKDSEKSLINLITNICEETKALHEKCKLIETRMKDVKAATCLNDYEDKIVLNIKKIQDDLEKCEIRSVLSELKKLLNRFNILRCENMLLPANEEEVKEFKKVITDCQNILQKISGFTEGEVLEKFTESFKEFTTISQEITSLKKITEDEIFSLQSETLKTCSHMFAQVDV